MFKDRIAIALGAVILSSPTSADIIDGEDLVDPTRPLLSMSVQGDSDDGVIDRLRNVVPSSYEVSFVRASESRPMAIVNGQRVTVGDVIGGATVLAIDRNGVTLSVDEQEQRIDLFGIGVKSPAKGAMSLP